MGVFCRNCVSKFVATEKMRRRSLDLALFGAIVSTVVHSQLNMANIVALRLHYPLVTQKQTTDGQWEHDDKGDEWKRCQERIEETRLEFLSSLLIEDGLSSPSCFHITFGVIVIPFVFSVRSVEVSRTFTNHSVSGVTRFQSPHSISGHEVATRLLFAKTPLVIILFVNLICPLPQPCVIEPKYPPKNHHLCPRRSRRDGEVESTAVLSRLIEG